MLTPRLMHAINTAATAHRDHDRKGSGIPYIAHLYAVVHLVDQVTDEEDVLIAALLHDTIEDVPEHYSEQQLRADFGDRVASIVLDLTKDPDLPSWQERSDAYLQHLEVGASEAAVLVSLADKYHNLASILDDHEVLGEKLWERFNSGKEQQQWWYRSIGEVVRLRLPKLELLQPYDALVSRLLIL